MHLKGYFINEQLKQNSGMEINCIAYLIHWEIHLADTPAVNGT
jgi:hypothetical protein